MQVLTDVNAVDEAMSDLMATMHTFGPGKCDDCEVTYNQPEGDLCPACKKVEIALLERAREGLCAGCLMAVSLCECGAIASRMSRYLPTAR